MANPALPSRALIVGCQTRLHADQQCHEFYVICNCCSASLSWLLVVAVDSALPCTTL